MCLRIYQLEYKQIDSNQILVLQNFNLSEVLVSYLFQIASTVNILDEFNVFCFEHTKDWIIHKGYTYSGSTVPSKNGCKWEYHPKKWWQQEQCDPKKCHSFLVGICISQPTGYD